MLGIEGLELTAADRARLAHPLAGGVILFARNYASPPQLAALTASIRSVREPHLLICVDHEGGRVQRFREGFTAIPPMRTLGERWDRDVAGATREAHGLGATIARELPDHGIDFTFAPVLDLDHGASGVIGDRAFHRNPNAAAHLAAALRRRTSLGRRMAAVGKHFPGHGLVAADSHDELPRRRAHRSLPSPPTISSRSQRSRSAVWKGSCPRMSSIRRSTQRPAGFSAQVAAGNPAGPARVRRRDLLR